MHAYFYELEEVQTQRGKQKRLRDSELEQDLKNTVKDKLYAKDLFVELKLGPVYNRIETPWIQIFTKENKSGQRGRYVGISFDSEKNLIELWIGFGKKDKRQLDIYEEEKQYRIKYSLIEPNLKYGFEYNSECDAVVINKSINIKEFKEEEFDRDLEYITNLYKEHEVRFENAVIKLSSKEENSLSSKKSISYEEINSRMLSLIEEVGNLASAIKELQNK